ncbi:TEA/ATTS domain family-domain-containing protein [Blakeslea trispora]|nr:TEA/ATTS domain family-domain-containing protein [Blakeslea trispora]
MLACPQDLFFHNDGKYPKVMHDQSLMLDKDKRIKQRKDSIKDFALHENDLSSTSSLKDKEEQVWPPDVESAFIEALESIPKLGRRKILVNGKPCGRNELISDYIFRKTCKIRTRKQVSSHIQVLKNTRKGDAHFMRLLTDSVDVDDTNATTNTTRSASSGNSKSKPRQSHASMHHLRHPHHPYHHSAKSILHPSSANKYRTHRYQPIDSSDESSINSSPSPTDYVFDIMCNDPTQQQALSMLQFKDFYDPFQQSPYSRAESLMNQTVNPMHFMDTNTQSLMMDPFFGSANDLLNPNNVFFTPNVFQSPTAAQHLENESLEPFVSPSAMTDEMLMNSLTILTNQSTTSNRKKTTRTKMPLKKRSEDPEDIKTEDHALWPNYLCLYLEYTLPYDPACRLLSHNLSHLAHCHPKLLQSCSDVISKEKCPSITSLTPNSDRYALLLAKTKLDLNLTISEFAFNNTAFFETQTRRTIECTTTIYSFGNVVLESKETQQAFWVTEGKYMYNFVFVNQFFDAFMKGIRSLQSWDEVDIAINNLCIVQSFHDVETKYTTSNEASSPSAENTSNVSTNTTVMEDQLPLLVMIYEFERGDGTIEMVQIEKDQK